MSDELPDNTPPADNAPDNNAPAPKADAAPEPKKDVAPEPKKDDAPPAQDWRAKLAAGDEKELKRLSRFASEADVWKAYRELEKKRDSGEYKRAYPKDGTPEEIAQWRKDNGVPESPDKYDLTFESGLVIGEADKPYISKFAENMFGANATNEQVKKAVESYYAIQQEQALAQQDLDAEYKETVQEELRAEWGADYKKNLKAMDSMLSQLPDEVRDAFATARAADGKLIGNHPEVIKWLTRQAFELNPIASVIPATGDNAMKSLNEEIAGIEKMIKDPKSDYWKGARADDLQSRYRDLLAAKAKFDTK